MTPPAAALPTDPEAILRSLRHSVHQALERKRLLNQDTVIWDQGRVRFIGPGAPTETQAQIDRANPQDDDASR